MTKKYRKKPLKMFFRLMNLFFSRGNQSDALVRKSYDRLSVDYDDSWTNHMRDLTEVLIDRMDIKPGQSALDLTCGTGFATGFIAARTGQKVIGVDISEGMLAQGRENHSGACEFIQADILEYLKSLEDNSFDIITCCWGLGYSKPFSVLRQIRRVLRKPGKVGIIDNTIFSLREVMYCSLLTFMEQPDKLENLMKFRFLMSSRQLGLWFRSALLKPKSLWAGSKSYQVDSGKLAIERLRATGGAAGFEYASKDADADEIFERFAEIVEQKYMKDEKVTVTHRFLGGIAVK
ncbi:MAG: methyltransferase domain-containing protein [Planctomycetes bacterium]|nr:methyltransferase domain-containing protein [Planctomycetota bacterium]